MGPIALKLIGLTLFTLFCLVWEMLFLIIPVAILLMMVSVNQNRERVPERENVQRVQPIPRQN